MTPNYLVRCILLLSFLSLLVGCEQTTDVRSSWPLFPLRFAEYKATPHYHALALGYIDREETIFFTVYGSGTVGEAIDAVFQGCDLELEKEGRDWGCYLFAIGNIDVRGMTREQLQQVIELYESNISATNEDFESFTN